MKLGQLPGSPEREIWQICDCRMQKRTENVFWLPK